MEFYIWTGEDGGCGVREVIARAGHLFPGVPTVVTPCLMADWCGGIGQIAALQQAEADWFRQIKRGDQCLMLTLSPEAVPGLTRLRRRGVTVLGWAGGTELYRKSVLRRLRQCDGVLAPDPASFQRAKGFGLKRVFLLAAEKGAQKR